jgi:hypothetical protein
MSERERLLEIMKKDYDDERDVGDDPEYDGDKIFDDGDQG